MKIKIFPGIFQCVILVLAFSLAACSTIPRLNVNYHLPQKDTLLEGKTVFLSVRDDRSNPSIIGKGAVEEFKNFSEYIFFYGARKDAGDTRADVLKITELIEKAMKRRLENAGAILVDKTPAEAQLVIALKDFNLDLVSRKWTLKAAYEANLMKKGRVAAKETVSVEGERFKTIGTKEADRLAGEIITDAVNRLNLTRLFANTGPISP